MKSCVIYTYIHAYIYAQRIQNISYSISAHIYKIIQKFLFSWWGEEEEEKNVTCGVFKAFVSTVFTVIKLLQVKNALLIEHNIIAFPNWTTLLGFIKKPRAKKQTMLSDLFLISVFPKYEDF